MIQDLSASLKAMLEKAPGLDAASVAFERPAAGYKPGSDTINLFLFDVRENTELRTNEPRIDRIGGAYKITPPPVRLACSYLVTAWPGSGAVGDAAVLAQQALLGAAVAAFTGSPVLDPADLRGSLVGAKPVVAIVAAQGDLMRNPAEFWAAIGGTLQPSISVTATIAMPSVVAPKTGPVVSSSTLRLRMPLDALALDAVHGVGGVVRGQDGAPLVKVAVSLVELGRQAETDADGRFMLGVVGAGSYTLSASRNDLAAKRKAVDVPGTAPAAFDLVLDPLT